MPTINEAARELGCGPSAIRSRVQAGEIAAEKQETRTNCFRYVVTEDGMAQAKAMIEAGTLRPKRSPAPPSPPEPQVEPPPVKPPPRSPDPRKADLERDLAEAQAQLVATRADLERERREAGEREQRLWDQLSATIQALTEPGPKALPESSVLTPNPPEPRKPWYRRLLGY